jgi:hypothetical protein
MQNETVSHMRDLAYSRAEADAKRVNGRIVLLRGVNAYGPGDDSDYYYFSPPIPFRVDHAEIDHVCEEWLDPLWDVTPVLPDDQLDGLRSFWADGPSYNLNDGRRESGSAVEDENGEILYV